MSIISLKGVSKEFNTREGKVNALTDINLEIEEGDIYGIIGLSGAGKSTLVRCMNLLEIPTEGKVVFDGEELTDRNKKELNKKRRNIAMIFQQFNLLMQKNVLRNVSFPLEIAGVSKKKAEEKAKELIKLVDLEDRIFSYPSQLSGGQKQRVAIARALSTNPKVLLCDEATSALDPDTTKSILRLLKKINRDYKITIIVITHEMEVVRQICNKVAIIEKGEIAETGTVEAVFKKPKSAAGRRLFFQKEDEPDLHMRTSVKNRVRLAFDDNRAYEPVIANMIIELKAPVNILYARMESVGENQKGQMVIGLSEDEEIARKQKEYLRGNKVTFIELEEGEANSLESNDLEEDEDRNMYGKEGR